MAALRATVTRGVCSSLFRGSLSQALGPRAACPRAFDVFQRWNSGSSLNFPDNLKYTKSHEWVEVNADNIARVGITDFAQSELGEIVYVDVSESDEVLQTGANFGCLEAVKTVSDLVMPVEGEVVEVNTELENTPDLVNKEPYGEGWIAKIKLADASEVDSLLSNEEYRKMVEN